MLPAMVVVGENKSLKQFQNYMKIILYHNNYGIRQTNISKKHRCNEPGEILGGINTSCRESPVTSVTVICHYNILQEGLS